MDLKRLPYLPIHFFYHPLSQGKKAFFLLAMSLVLISVGFLVFIYQSPTAFSLDTFELSSSLLEEASIEQVEADYRSFDVEFPLYWQKISFAAGPILPKLFPIFLFAILQILAWTLVITSLTEIKSRWIYLFFLLFALFIHFSGVHKLWYEGEGMMGRLLEFGIMISYLGLAFLFQTRTLKWGIWGRFLAFFALSVIWFGIPLAKGNIVDGHAFLQEGFYYNLFLFVPFLIFVGKDIVNLIVLAGTNRPDRANRWPYGVVLVILFLLVIIQLLWFHEFFNWGFLGKDFRLSFRPTHLLAIAAIFTVFTSQNQYHQVKSILTSQFVYSLFIACWVILAINYVSINLASGDLVFVYTIDRMIAIFFTCVSIAYIFFIVVNHSELLRHKINLYYLLPQARDFNFYVVWLLSLGGIVVLEGMEKWKSFDLISHTYTLHVGDAAWLDGNAVRAQKAYDLAGKSILSSVKAHYNQAALSVLRPNGQEQAIKHYQDAVRTFNFPYAWLNAAQLLNERGRANDAMDLLEAASKRMPANHSIANNLALNYWDAYMADSAIASLKRGLLAHPDEEVLLSNLGLLYHVFERPKEAASFLGSSVEKGSPSPHVWTNHLVWNILHDKPSAESAKEYKDIIQESFWLTYHHFLANDLSQPDSLGVHYLQAVANEANVPEAILLDGWRLMKQDSMERGESRLSFLANGKQAYNSQANYLLGVSYFQKGMKSMARYHFNKQGEVGEKEGYYYAALMDLDQGFKQAASNQLTVLRGLNEELFEDCSKELAMLLKAYGQDLYAQTEWDLSSLNLNERIRTGIYADSLGQFAFALENFRQVIAYDSMTIAPYLELGKIYNKYQDSFAIENLLFGLDKEPDNEALKREIAKAHIIAGHVSEALSYMDTTSSLAEDQLLLGEWKLAKGEAEKAQNIWEKLFEQDKMNQAVILRLAEFFESTDNYAAGYDLLSKALIINDKNPFYWHYYAKFARGYEEPADAKMAAEKAIELLPESELKQQIIKDFL